MRPRLRTHSYIPIIVFKDKNLRNLMPIGCRKKEEGKRKRDASWMPIRDKEIKEMHLGCLLKIKRMKPNG